MVFETTDRGEWMKIRMSFNKIAKVICLFLLISVVGLIPCIKTNATAEEFQQQAEARKLSPVLSDSWSNWPKGPVNGAEGAVLMDLDTGAELYSKNPEGKAFPASITKLMTALVVMDHCAMDEMVTFSHNAVYSIERGSSNVGIDEGQSMTVQECLYCLMLASANEVANALAEHVGGSVEGFADMMNEKAAALGCTNTHFVNPNGLHDDEHYTCARDMALIARAFALNPKLLEISGTISYSVEATATQPDSFTISNHHRMLEGSLYGKKYAYENAIGGKTGFTVMARETLVTFGEKDGMRLVAVVLREEPYDHYTDTKALLEYGFNEFQRIDPLEKLREEDIVSMGLQEGQTLEAAMATLPKGAELMDCSFSVENDKLNISYDGRVIGTGRIARALVEEEPLPIKEIETLAKEEEEKDREPGEDASVEKEEKAVSPKTVVIIVSVLVVILAAAGIVLFEIHKSQEAEYRKRELMEKRRRRQERWEREDNGEYVAEYEEDDTFDDIPE